MKDVVVTVEPDVSGTDIAFIAALADDMAVDDTEDDIISFILSSFQIIISQSFVVLPSLMVLVTVGVRH